MLCSPGRKRGWAPCLTHLDQLIRANLFPRIFWKFWLPHGFSFSVGRGIFGFRAPSGSTNLLRNLIVKPAWPGGPFFSVPPKPQHPRVGLSQRLWLLQEAALLFSFPCLLHCPLKQTGRIEPLTLILEDLPFSLEYTPSSPTVTRWGQGLLLRAQRKETCKLIVNACTLI